MKKKPTDKDLKATVKFLKQFMNLNRKGQLDVIAKIEKGIKGEEDGLSECN